MMWCSKTTELKSSVTHCTLCVCVWIYVCIYIIYDQWYPHMFHSLLAWPLPDWRPLKLAGEHLGGRVRDDAWLLRKWVSNPIEKCCCSFLGKYGQAMINRDILVGSLKFRVNPKKSGRSWRHTGYFLDSFWCAAQRVLSLKLIEGIPGSQLLLVGGFN